MKNGERLYGPVAVGVGLDDGDGIGIRARGLLAQDAVIAAQGRRWRRSALVGRVEGEGIHS